MPETQTVQITCPNCGNTYQTPVRSIIDVGQNPQLRQAFLAGQINMAVCPKCSTGGTLEVPLVYHDPAAEFLAVYFPPQLQLPEMERQKMIGELTQTLMRGLPSEQRKGYFLNPRQFISRQGLTDAVLGTMGISQEELDRQRKKAKLVDQLAVMADDPKGLQMMIKGQDALLDYEFFAILGDLLQRHQATGNEKAANQLTMLRDRLMELTTFGKRARRQAAAVASLKDIATPEQFLEKVVAADSEEVEAIAIAARPMMDYQFFQALTARMEASQGAEHDRLRVLRDHLADVTQRVDDATRATLQDATTLLQELLASDNPRSAVREHVAEIDDAFMAVLRTNMQEAQRRGAKAALERMSVIYDELTAMVDESMPPELRLINDLLASESSDEVRSLLQERRAEITPEFIDIMGKLAEEISGREDEESIETAKRLRDIKAQAMLLV